MAYYNSYNPKLLEGVERIHFIGCGGSGMFPLIQILHARGYSLTGSDVGGNQDHGVRTCHGDDRDHRP